MADIRDIRFRARLPNFEWFFGLLLVTEATAALQVQSFQKGTVMIDVVGHSGGKMSFIVEGTNNKGQNRWFNLDPLDEDIEISANGNYASTYETEVTWIRIRWVSGTATTVKVSASISKTIIGSK